MFVVGAVGPAKMAQSGSALLFTTVFCVVLGADTKDPPRGAKKSSTDCALLVLGVELEGRRGCEVEGRGGSSSLIEYSSSLMDGARARVVG